MILTNEKGVPFMPPSRESFPEGIDGFIEYMRVKWAYRDRLRDCANKAFDEALTRKIRKP